MGEASSKGRWIKLYCKITEWEWYNDLATKVVFLHLLFTANWKPAEWHGITIERGQRLVSLRNLARDCQLSLQQIRTALKHLNTTHEITQCTVSKYTIITITNYDVYQGDNTLANTEITAKQHDANTGYITIEDRTIEDNNNLVRDFGQSGKYSSDFEQLWSIYPKKVKKQEAYKAYKCRIYDGYSHNELLYAVQCYAKDCHEYRREKEYIMLCSRFIGPYKTFVDYLPKNEGANGV